MKQYCRYCLSLVTGNGIWCMTKEKEIAESTAKAVNNCKEFEFCEEDAFLETNGYKPRLTGKQIPAVDEISENQICMDGI